jgi:hypothetical protein|tara:strand:- start:5702 stop:6058 length:357 start_codon:yes stop_codon:yes gene_type:complete
LRVQGWKDLPKDRSTARYEIPTDDGGTRVITLKSGNRVVLDSLIARPLLCASPVRISDRVCILRHEYGVPIDREMYDGDEASEGQRFGVYFIGQGVRRIEQGADREFCHSLKGERSDR